MIDPKTAWKKLESRLNEAGFPVSGAVDFERAREPYSLHVKRYQTWIESKYHGEMAYLERGLLRRQNPKLVFPELKSVVSVLYPYRARPIEKNGLRYARYLNESDYHDRMKQKLEEVFQNFTEQEYPLHYKVCVDTSAVLERAWAELTGLGWIGKNTLLIHPQYGSYVFLGTVFTDFEFEKAPLIKKDYCGECTRCLKACPPSALKPHELNAKLCISYQTLEKRGPFDDPEFSLSGYLAGCDLCQEACPFNLKRVNHDEADEISSHLELDQNALQNETEEEYQKRVKGTALARVKFLDFKRNLALASRKS